MDGNDPERRGQGGKPEWFLGWLREVFLPASKNPLAEQIEQFENAVGQLPNIDEALKKSLTTTLSTEVQIIQGREDDKSQIQKLLKTAPAILGEPVPMPWSQLTESEAKIISRVVENIKQQDFATKSIRHWSIHFADVFDKFFISSRIGRIAIVYNSCSASLKQRLLALDVGDKAKSDSYSYLELLQLITAVVHSPNARDDATMQIYKGFRQNNTESVQTFLQRVRDVAEEAFGPSSSWAMSQASLLLKKICEGLQSSELAKLTASIIVVVPFQWNTLCESILQFSQRVRVNNPETHVNAVQQPPSKSPVCFKCGAAHYMKDCRLLICKHCGLQHQHSECSRAGQRTFCSKCKSKFHNLEGHFKFAPDNVKPRPQGINMIEPTSFLEGAVSMDGNHSGNIFVNSKILIDTGALIPTGVAISEDFFTNQMRGKLSDLRPSNLDAANGASSNSTMETVGQLEVKIRFNQMSTIFSGSAVVLKNLSLPVIIGVNFLKTNSLSPVLEPLAARVVHSTTAEAQDLIANVSNRSRPLTKTPRKSFDRSPPLSRFGN